MFWNLEGTFKPGHPNSLQRPVQQVNLQQAQGCLPNTCAQRFNALMMSLQKFKSEGQKGPGGESNTIFIRVIKGPGENDGNDGNVLSLRLPSKLQLTPLPWPRLSRHSRINLEKAHPR